MSIKQSLADFNAKYRLDDPSWSTVARMLGYSTDSCLLTACQLVEIAEIIEAGTAKFWDCGEPAPYGTFLAHYPATGETIVVGHQEPTTEVGRVLAEELRELR